MTRRIVDNHDINTKPGQFSLLGFRTSTNPGYKKRCLDLLLEKGSAAKAAEALGISPTTVNHHAWTYLIAHMDEARKILDSTAEGDNRYGRSLTDDVAPFAFLVLSRTLPGADALAIGLTLGVFTLLGGLALTVPMLVSGLAGLFVRLMPQLIP